MRTFPTEIQSLRCCQRYSERGRCSTFECLLSHVVEMTFLTSLIPMKLGRKRRDKERFLKVQSDEEQNFVPPIRFVPHLICLNKQRNFTSNQYSCCCALSSLGRFRFPSLRVASPPTSLPPRSPTVSVTVLESTLIVPISALLRVVPEMSVVAIASGAALAIIHLRVAPSPAVHLRRVSKGPLPGHIASSASSARRRVAAALLGLSVALSSPR